MSFKTIIGYLVVLAILVGGVLVWGMRGAAPAVTSVNDPNRPQAVVDATTFDFGSMTNQDIREREFTITNNGQNELVLSQVSTSCDCTYAYITANNETSPRFTMHDTNSWSVSLKKGEKATVKVVYEPSIMPVQGQVSRLVSVTTNDPNQPTITFTVNANVTK